MHDVGRQSVAVGYLRDLGDQTSITFSELSAFITEHFWIGGTDTVKEGKWVWMSSQDPLDYKDWAHNEPNNGIEGGCMTMANHLRFHWNDDLCNSQINFICEKT